MTKTNPAFIVGVGLFVVLICSFFIEGSSAAVCGNGIVEAGEYCDVGANNGKKLSCCTYNCQVPAITVQQSLGFLFGGCAKQYTFSPDLTLMNYTNFDVSYNAVNYTVYSLTPTFTTAQLNANIRLLNTTPPTFDFAAIVPTGIGYLGTVEYIVSYQFCATGPYQMFTFNRTAQSILCCGNGRIDLGEANDTASNGLYGGCTTNDTCLAPSTGLPPTLTINMTNCGTFVNSTVAKLVITATGYNYKLMLANVTGVAGLTATFNSTGIFFNRAFVGSAVLTFTSLNCNATGSYETIVRTIASSGCCSGSSTCLSGYVLGGSGSCCTTNCLAFNTGILASTSVLLGTCTLTVSSATLQLVGVTNFDANWRLYNQTTGLAGVTATFDGTTMTFNQHFTGTVTATFQAATCNTTSSYVYVVRTINMGCCENNVVDPGEQCDNTTAGGCCLISCANATSLTAYNANPNVTSVINVGYNVFSVSIATLQIYQTGMNYPLGFRVVSAVPDPYTFIPNVPPVWSITTSALSWSDPFIGTYVVNISMPYCDATGGAFYFIRNITMAALTSNNPCFYLSGVGNYAMCNPSSGSGRGTRCDCSVYPCFSSLEYTNCAGFGNASTVCPAHGTYAAGYCCTSPPATSPTCGRDVYYNLTNVCQDVRQPKPRTVTLYNYYDSQVSGSPYTNTYTCPAICGDMIQDTNETCDTGGVYGSCCTTTCNASSPNIGFPSVASITVNCSKSISTTTLQLTTSTSNFGYQLELYSVTDTGGLAVPGLSAVLNYSALTFNASFTGSVVVTVRTRFCNATNSYIYYARTITSSCCGNGVTDVGEQCDLGANNGGVGGTCCSSQCAFILQSLNYVCRASTDLCDVQETCSGTSASCPADSVQPNNTMCAAATPCTSLGTCNGVSKSCIITTYGTGSNHTCRASTGACDPAEYCTCVNSTCGICPADVKYNSTYACRPSIGGCDIAEYCDGVSSTCPADVYEPMGFVCRNKTGACDVAETCSGVTGTCPSDAVAPNTVLCMNSTGPCQAPSYCSGLDMDKTCPAAYYYDSTTPCRPSIGVCDVTEYCVGNSSTCPADESAPFGAVCRAAAGICDIQEVCDGVNPTCPPNIFYDTSNVCHESNGPCDPPEFCTGSSALCPTDVLLPVNYTCSPSSGVCQLSSVCDGVTPGCPTNALLTNSTTCRPSAGVCDTPETCTGVDINCPADTFVSSDTVCLASTGMCMPTSYCPGNAATCNIQPIYGSSQVCRPAEGACDVADTCNGVSTQCPSDKVRPKGYVCGPAIGLCAFNSTCTGIDKTCPLYLTPSGSGCHVDSNLCFEDYWNITDPYNPVCTRGPAINYDDGLYCNGLETCNATTGLKIAGTPIVCNDGSSCTRDTCNNVLGACVFTPWANTEGPCGGGLGACVPGEYQCDGSGSLSVVTCVGAVTPIDEICGNGIDDNCNGEVDEFCSSTCTTSADCLSLNPGQCTTLTCSDGTCVPSYSPLNTPCDDLSICTTHDVCNGYGLCAGASIVCDDYNECTYDYCDESQGRCIFDGQYYQNVSCSTDNLCSARSQCNNQGQCVVTSTLECSGVKEACVEYVCNASTGSCENVAILGVSCDDGNSCTYNDVCTVDGCIGSPKLCDDFNSCTENTCLAPCGMCSNNVIDEHCYIDGMCYENGAQKQGDPCSVCNVTENAYQWSFIVTSSPIFCDDADPCTTFDVCNQYISICAGTPVDCSYLDTECSTGLCEYGQCTTQPANIGNTCDSGLYCSFNDQCDSNGNCVGTPVDCSSYSTSCSVSQCIEEGLGCVSAPIANFTRCVLNNDACDGEEFCFDGECISSGALNCSEVVVNNNPCIEYTCDVTYGCVATPLYMQACDDGNPCTIGDFCGVDGTCYPGWIPLQCDQGTPDTEVSCLAGIGCVYTNVGDTSTCIVDSDCPAKTCQNVVCANNACRYIAQSIGTRCSDGNVCNGEEYCTGNGVCMSLIQLDCNDNNDCTEDSCDEMLGCIFTPLNGNMCNDNNICTQQDICVSGTCTGTEYPCPDDTDCMNYACENIDGNPFCIGTPVHAYGSCFIDDQCQYGGSCTTYGTCSTHTKPCPAPTDCIASYSCEGGDCIPAYIEEGQQCNTENLCVTSFCDGSGNCVADGDLATICSPQSSCQTEGACIPQTGECAYQFMENGATCDDGNLCTSGDSCLYGDCVGQESVVCESLSQCYQQGSCDPSTGVCSTPAFPDNYPCNDGNACTSTDTCISGECTGIVGVQCTEYSDNPCYVPRCDPVYGCLYDQVDGIACDDGNECTTNTTCNSGVCGGGEDVNCYDEFFCGVSYCAPAFGCLLAVDNDCSLCTVDVDCPYIPCKTPFCNGGVCAYQADDLAVTGCDDSQYCNGVEKCHLGSCILGEPPNCDDGNECTTDTCNYNIGQCTHSNVASSTTCSNDDLCALAAQCDGQGHCLTTSTVTCDTSNPCRISSGCDSMTGACSYTVLADGASCNNGDLCSDVSVCVSGVCNSIERVSCSTSSWCDPSSVCIQETGLCATSPSNGLWCSDDNVCTLGDVCDSSGVCHAGTYGFCDYVQVSDSQCQVAQCSDDGTCTIVNLADDTSCDTGMPVGTCSGRDVCSSGVCTRTYNPGLLCREADLTGCDVPDYCVSGNDYCPEDNKIADGTTCESEVFCYSTVCMRGQCVNDQPTNCSAYDTECTTGYCDEVNRQCTYTNLVNGIPCTGTEWGQCVSYSGCYYGACVTYYESSATSCTDGNLCTQDEHCSGYDASCIGGSPINCSSFNSQCTVGVCSSMTGSCQAQIANQGSSCNADSNPCTVNDTCHLGTCVAGSPMNCSYLNNNCQYGTCVAQSPTTGTCSTVLTAQACSPNACTGNCTVPFQWWAIHNSKCVVNRKFVWPNNFESRTMCGSSYYSWSQVQYGNFAWRFLFQQWLGASLNAINGACVPSNIAANLTSAYNLLIQCNTGQLLTSIGGTIYSNLAIALYSYNTGAFGPGMCNPTACLYAPYGDAHCLFLSGIQARDVIDYEGDGTPSSDEVCLNGVWNFGLLSCSCTPGWTGLYCDQCGEPDDPNKTYMCVPSFQSPWAYTLQMVPTANIDRYLSDDNAYALIGMTNRSAYLPGTYGLDCGCRYSDGGVISLESSRDITISATDNDITVYITTVNNDLTLCTEFFDIVVSNSESFCSIDGVYCTQTNPDNNSTSDVCGCCEALSVMTNYKEVTIYVTTFLGLSVIVNLLFIGRDFVNWLQRPSSRNGNNRKQRQSLSPKRNSGTEGRVLGVSMRYRPVYGDHEE